MTIFMYITKCNISVCEGESKDGTKRTNSKRF